MRTYPEEPDTNDAQAPARSLHQRMDALDRANEIRSYRAQLKQDIKAGRENVLDYLMYPNEMVQTMKVMDLMLAAPKYGRKKVNKLLIQSRISPSKTISGMSDRQRNELTSLMGRH